MKIAADGFTADTVTLLLGNIGFTTVTVRFRYRSRRFHYGYRVLNFLAWLPAHEVLSWQRMSEVAGKFGETPFGGVALLQAERAFGDRNDEAMIFKQVESARSGSPANAQLGSCLPNRIF